MARINEFVPSFYRNIVDFNHLTKVENDMFEQAEAQTTQIIDNQFVQSCNEKGLVQFEKMLSITAAPGTESLQFRKDRVVNHLSTRPPFTLQFLKNQLDSIIGKNRYKVYMDYAEYTLYVESTLVSQNWYSELLVTVNSIKPANIVFINKPVILKGVKLNESMTHQESQFARLGFWSLGTTPFKSKGKEEVIKMPESTSLTPKLLDLLASDLAAKITKIRLNDSKEITVFTTKEAVGSTVQLEYVVPKYEDLVDISKVEILSQANEVLSVVNVYIPLLSETVLKHSINLKEGA